MCPDLTAGVIEDQMLTIYLHSLKSRKRKKEKDGIKYEAKVVLSKDIYPVSDIEPPRLYRRVIYLIQAATPDRIKLS